MRPRDASTTEPRCPPLSRELLTENAIRLPRRATHTEHFSISQVKNSDTDFDLIASTNGQTSTCATLIFPKLARADARALKKLLSEAPRVPEGLEDPFPAVTIAANAMVYAAAQNLTVTTPTGGTGHDEVSRFFDDDIKRFSMLEIQSMFRVEGLGDNIYHLSFPNQFLMNSCFERLQEHFESPKFRGKIFTHEEFRAWYRMSREHKEFSYYTDWSGCNLPGYVLTSFLNGKFDPLRPGERAVVETFRGMKGPLYIIATLQSDTVGTLRHELAHALYHTNLTYRSAVDQLLDTVNCAPINRLLKSLGYHRAQWRDEVHAYLGDEPSVLESHGINSVPYTRVRRELLRLYNRHSPLPHHR